jgi:hypothetical protein
MSHEIPLYSSHQQKSRWHDRLPPLALTSSIPCLDEHEKHQGIVQMKIPFQFNMATHIDLSLVQ